MKTEKIPSKRRAALNLILAAAVIILGAVFRRTHAPTGQWITVAGLAWYVLSDIVPAGRMLRRFTALAAREKAHVFIVGVMLLLFVRSFFVIDGLTYFMSIVLLAVDYLLLESDPPENHEQKDLTL